MKCYWNAAIAIAAIGSAAPASAGLFEDCRLEAETHKKKEIATNCSGLRDRALETCTIRYEKAASQSLAACTQAQNQRVQFDQVRARRTAEAAAAKARRAAQTPQ